MKSSKKIVSRTFVEKHALHSPAMLWDGMMLASDRRMGGIEKTRREDKTRENQRRKRQQETKREATRREEVIISQRCVNDVLMSGSLASELKIKMRLNRFRFEMCCTSNLLGFTGWV